jgi:hypothetical protein
MHSKEYMEARHEFINCFLMAIVCFGVPLVLAFKEWKPIMREELRKERAAGNIAA